MARYNTPVTDWTVKLPPGVRTKTKRVGFKTLQQGVTIFSRKKKNACRLSSASQIRRSIEKTTQKGKQVGCKAVFPKISLHGEPQEKPKVKIFAKKKQLV